MSCTRIAVALFIIVLNTKSLSVKVFMIKVSMLRTTVCLKCNHCEHAREFGEYVRMHGGCIHDNRG